MGVAVLTRGQVQVVVVAKIGHVGTEQKVGGALLRADLTDICAIL